MNVLTLNAGSSSLKYAIHAVNDGRAKRIESNAVEVEPTAQAFSQATAAAIEEALRTHLPIDALGHRIVFGGPDDLPAFADPGLLARLSAFEALDPLHAPGALACLRLALQRFPERPQVVCFDTAFFREMPAAARRLPIPVKDPVFLRRYGFHGLSYEYVRSELRDDLHGRSIIAHLGSGASLAALRDGEPIDTTMGFSSLGGVVMATRPGDLDPGVLLYLLEEGGMSVAALRTLLEQQSGLRAISGGEGDLRLLLERRADAHVNAAVDAFVISVVKAAGALSAVLGGLDTLVFTGGIGEHLPEVRRRVVDALAYLGIRINDAANAVSAAVISDTSSRVIVRVIATDENAAIAYRTAETIEHHQGV